MRQLISRSCMTAFCLVTLLYGCRYSRSGLYDRKVTIDDSARAGEVIADSLFGIELTYIPSGTIRFDADYERHETVVFLKSFYIGRYEVTQAQWNTVMGDNPSDVRGDSLPVTNVSWFDAEAFVEKLSGETGYVYRLPTESEWEYACRAGTDTDFYFGNDTLLIGEYDWWKRNSGDRIHPVGRKLPNPWGLYDMGGNVCEWTATLWDPMPWYRMHPERERFDDNLRIVCSSSYVHRRTAQFRSDYRHAYREHGSNQYTGLRVVREL